MGAQTRLYGMAALGYAHRTLRADTVAGDAQTADRIDDPIEGQLITYLSVGTEIASRVGFNMSLPIATYQFRGADPQIAATMIRHGNRDSVTNSVIWDPSITVQTLPPSLVYTQAPSWWGTTPWPPFGPDVAASTSNKIPAHLRYEALGSP